MLFNMHGKQRTVAIFGHILRYGLRLVGLIIISIYLLFFMIFYQCRIFQQGDSVMIRPVPLQAATPVGSGEPVVGGAFITQPALPHGRSSLFDRLLEIGSRQDPASGHYYDEARLWLAVDEPLDRQLRQ